MSVSSLSIKNPFTPTFGCPPAVLVGRDDVLDNILGGLDNAPGDPNRASIIVGPRGSGKTVLLATIVEQASSRGWLAVNVSSGPGLLEEILVQIQVKGEHLLSKQANSFVTEIQLAGAGLSRQAIPKKSTWRSQITALVQELNNQDIGLLVAVDEVSPRHEELRVLVDVFQHLVSERRDVALMLAGLPAKVSLLLHDEDLSFLRRAFQHYLNPISDSDVLYALKETVEDAGRHVSVDALSGAVQDIKGFVFLLQLVGYHMWRQNANSQRISKEAVEAGISLAKMDMERMILDATANELTARELDYLVVMAGIETPCKTAHIAEEMGVTIEHASNIRKSLIEKGIIRPAGHGKVDFDMPFMKDYLYRNYAHFEIE